MTEKYDKSGGILTDFSKVRLYAAQIIQIIITVMVLCVIAVIAVIAVEYISLMSVPQYEGLEQLVTATIGIILSIIIFLYVLQFFAVLSISIRQPQRTRVVEVHGKWRAVHLEESSSVLRWTINDAIHNSGPWIFFIVAIFLPVMLSIIPDVFLVLENDEISEITEDFFLTKAEFAVTSIMYYLCLSLIAILITIEASILMNFKYTAGVWIGMILASMILDITSFLILYSMGDPLEKWNKDEQIFVTTGPQLFVFLAFFCTISSSFTIMIARASREMVFEALAIRGAASGEGAASKKMD